MNKSIQRSYHFYDRNKSQQYLFFVKPSLKSRMHRDGNEFKSNAE